MCVCIAPTIGVNQLALKANLHFVGSLALAISYRRQDVVLEEPVETIMVNGGSNFPKIATQCLNLPGPKATWMPEKHCIAVQYYIIQGWARICARLRERFVWSCPAAA